MDPRINRHTGEPHKHEREIERRKRQAERHQVSEKKGK
jgi:hypothetical protein